jgi:antitoxin component YwqK of YwqJK toxin-antitoxin module
MMRNNLLILLFLGISCHAFAQDDAQSLEQLFELKYDTPLTLDLEDQDELNAALPKKEKKKKKNPKIYYGIKTKRGFTRTGFGDNTVVELFHYLKKYEGPEPYMRNFYWYDFKKKKIINSLRVKPEYAGVLHGHYVKKLGDQILEEGFFYKGMKHKRWIRLNRHDILQEKELFWKGWPKESQLTYYDYKKEKLRSAVPIHFGEKEGNYYAYHKNGNIAVLGQFKYDNKIGLWREYYDNRKIKREVRYPIEPFDFKTKPVIIKEWGRDGKVIYDRDKFLKGK